jgi:hypothetical protein
MRGALRDFAQWGEEARGDGRLGLDFRRFMDSERQPGGRQNCSGAGWRNAYAGASWRLELTTWKAIFNAIFSRVWEAMV